MTLSPHGVCLIGPHEEQVDVGARRQLAAAIAAGRDDGEALGRGRVLRVVEMLGREIVEHLDQRILHCAQRTRGGETVERAAFDAAASSVRASWKRCLISASASARSLVLSLRARQRRQRVAQIVAVEKRAFLDRIHRM